jgi:hypothetical protein
MDQSDTDEMVEKSEAVEMLVTEMEEVGMERANTGDTGVELDFELEVTII